MKKKYFSLLLATAILTGTISGCGTSEASDNDSLNKIPTESVSTEAEEINEYEAKVPESSENEVPTEAANSSADILENTANWKEYIVVVNGAELTLPTDYASVCNATGLHYDSAEEKSYLGGGKYSDVNFLNTDGNVCLYAEAVNTSESDALYTECAVSNFVQTSMLDKAYDIPVMVFPGSIYVNKAINYNELIELFGEPDFTDSWVDEDGDTYIDTYKWCEDAEADDTNYYEIKVKDGSYVYEVELDCKGDVPFYNYSL